VEISLLGFYHRFYLVRFEQRNELSFLDAKDICSLKEFLESLNFLNMRTFVLLRFSLHMKSKHQLRKQSVRIYTSGLAPIIVSPPSVECFSACKR